MAKNGTPMPPKQPQQRIFNEGDAPTDPNAAAQIAELNAKLETTTAERNHAWAAVHELTASRDAAIAERDQAIEIAKKWQDTPAAQAEELKQASEERRLALTTVQDLTATLATVTAERDDARADTRLARKMLDRMQTEQAKLVTELGQVRHAHSKARSDLQDRAVAGPGKTLADVGTLS